MVLRIYRCKISEACRAIFFSRNTIIAEWVEIPQFSDESKVYRLPVSVKHDQLYKIHFGNPIRNELRNVSRSTVLRMTNVNKVKEIINDYADLTSQSLTQIQFRENNSPFRNKPLDDKVDINQENIRDSFDGTYSSDVDDNDDDVSIDIEEDEYKDDMQTQMESPVKVVMNDFEINDASLTTESTIINDKDNMRYETIYNETSFFDYLPMEILKNVHQTLKSQPATLKGKIRFLKTFERTLMTEIESRLAASLAPSRRIRGASDDHYESDDDSLGFPSLEGALMAISFLTFAVYLVRLVILLFRNLGTTTTTATVVLGRRKRSSERLNQDTARVLNYLETFVSN